MSKHILTFIETLNAGPLQKILLTHGHPDHIGALEQIRVHRAVPVYVHRNEIPFMEGKQPYPGRKKAKELVKSGVSLPLKETIDGLGLESMGNLKPYYTPGHSPGHVVYYHHQDQILIGGDLFSSNSRGLKRPIPIFTADMKQAILSGQIVKELKPRLLSICHGFDVPQPHLHYDQFAEKWLTQYS
jgi:glyoxylase-like metal-dependent hydrolase (beta-lactamase superfamily II)